MIQDELTGLWYEPSRIKKAQPKAPNKIKDQSLKKKYADKKTIIFRKFN